MFMKIFAISDLHLSGKVEKPMDIFGGNWVGYFDKIKEDWKSKVSSEDIVLIAGDISWALAFNDGLYDLNSLKELKGKKIFIRGNHDYWWSGINKLRDNAPDDTFYFLQNDSVKINDTIICGSRGWTCPGCSDFAETDQKLYLREAERFRLALESANKLRQEGDKLIAMIHFPPFNYKKENSLFTDLFEKNKVDKVIFGHLHKEYYPIKTVKNGIEYYLSSCDILKFNLIEIN